MNYFSQSASAFNCGLTAFKKLLHEELLIGTPTPRKFPWSRCVLDLDLL